MLVDVDVQPTGGRVCVQKKLEQVPWPEVMFSGSVALWSQSPVKRPPSGHQPPVFKAYDVWLSDPTHPPIMLLQHKLVDQLKVAR